MSTLNSDLAPESLQDDLGTFFEAFGIRRNVGRIWAVLYLADVPMSQAELVDATGFSAGMVSESVKELLHWGAIRVVAVRGSRATHYEALENLLRIVSTILNKRELEAVRALRESVVRARRETRPDPLLERRLHAIEVTTHLYEVMTGIVSQLARLPIRALPVATRALAKLRFSSGDDE